jgi:uncharacterized protein (TIGR00725 family)
MGSGTEAHEDEAAPLGRWLAELGVHLLTGGGGGVMAAVSRAFCETPGRRGLVIGVLPAGDAPGASKPGYPSPWVEIPILTHLPSTGTQGAAPTSRNHVNILSSDVVIALGGGAGTRSEIQLALAYRRPVMAFIARRTDLPRIPDEVATSGSLADVQAFVRRALRTRGAP